MRTTERQSLCRFNDRGCGSRLAARRPSSRNETSVGRSTPCCSHGGSARYAGGRTGCARAASSPCRSPPAELELSAPPTGQLGGDTVRSARSPILSPERARVPAQTRTGGLSVRSQGGSRQLEVYVDGTSYGHSPVDLQLSPGVHSVWLVPVGSENQKKTYDVEIVVGEVKTLSF